MDKKRHAFKNMRMKVYLVVFTDRWGVDYVTVEAWDDKTLASGRAKELTGRQSSPEDYYYEVTELEINRKYDDERKAVNITPQITGERRSASD